MTKLYSCDRRFLCIIKGPCSKLQGMRSLLDSNAIRPAGFCQLGKEVRGSTEHLIIGSDITKERDSAFIGTVAGRTLHKGMFVANTCMAFQKLLVRTDALKMQQGLRKSTPGLEPAADHHTPGVSPPGTTAQDDLHRREAISSDQCARAFMICLLSGMSPQSYTSRAS